jgi:hypothetical protein
LHSFFFFFEQIYHVQFGSVFTSLVHIWQPQFSRVAAGVVVVVVVVGGFGGSSFFGCERARKLRMEMVFGTAGGEGSGAGLRSGLTVGRKKLEGKGTNLRGDVWTGFGLAVVNVGLEGESDV